MVTHIPQSPHAEAMPRRPIHHPRPEHRFTGPGSYFPRDIFMHEHAPEWWPLYEERSGQPASYMYATMNSGRGPVFYSQRLAQWLDSVPDDRVRVRTEVMEGPLPRPQEAQPHRQGEDSHGDESQSPEHGDNSHLDEDQLPHPSRARSNSAPLPSTISNNHLMRTLDHRTAPQNAIMPLSADSPAVHLQDMPTIPGTNHPDPLRQHPIVLEDLPIQLRIPERKSSLRNSARGSQPSQVPAPLTPRAAPEDLVQGIESIHIGSPIGPEAIQTSTGHQESLEHPQTKPQGNKAPGPAGHRLFSTCVNQLFGKDNRDPDTKKQARTEVTISTIPCSQPGKPFAESTPNL